MSVCRKLPDGTVQKIAGHTILLDANASEVREGTINIPAYSGEPLYHELQVTLSDPMPDTDYAVIWNVDKNSPYWAEKDIKVGSRTTTTFKFLITIHNDGGGSPAGTVLHYFAFKPIKLDGYTALQNKINNPDETPTIDSMNLVTSDGVARAIENASAVWKGTSAEWNTLPAADKMKYDLAVLLDTTLVKAVDREDGTETDVANLNKVFRGTQAQWDALSSAQKDEYDQAEISGNANEGVTYVADVVEEGNMNPVTSDAVYDALNDVEITGELANPMQAAAPFYYTKKGSVALISCIMTGGLPSWTMPTPGTWVTVATLPENCRPTNRIYTSDQGANPCVRWIIERNGDVKCYYFETVTPGYECTLYATFITQ